MLSVAEFGGELIRTQDLDPGYVSLVGAGLPQDQLSRLCLSYWCFYHLGAASYLSELKGKRYWEAVHTAAANLSSPKLRPGERWPRAAERRHFRGQQAIQAVEELANRYKTPEHAIDGFLGTGPSSRGALTYGSVAKAAMSHRGFGQWIAFKIADMSERVLGYDTDFNDCELGIYKDPRQGAALIHFGDWQHPITDEELRETVTLLVKQFRAKKYKAPPSRDRLVNVQEVETILCKYKSYYKSHYRVGKDITEIRHGLLGWGETSQALLAAMPKEVA